MSRPTLRKESTFTLEDGDENLSKPTSARRLSTRALMKKMSLSKIASIALEDGDICTAFVRLDSGSHTGKTSSLTTAKSTTRGMDVTTVDDDAIAPDETPVEAAVSAISELPRNTSTSSFTRAASLTKKASLPRKASGVYSAPPLPPGGLIEIAISFDTTGSMYGCLKEVKRKIQDIVQKLQADIPGIRISIIAHGDYYDKANYIVKWIDFGADVKEICHFVKNVGKTSGGDRDECYELVLRRAQEVLSWTPGSQRSLVIIGDAAPHEPGYRYGDFTNDIDWRVEAKELADMGVRIYSVGAKLADETVPFYKEIADITGGKVIGLNDFSIIFDMLMTICYHEGGMDLSDAYESEVRARNGGRALDAALEALFARLKDKEPEPVSTMAFPSSPFIVTPFKSPPTLGTTFPTPVSSARPFATASALGAIPLPFPSSSLMGTPSLSPFGKPLSSGPLSSSFGTVIPATTLGKTPKVKRKYTKKTSPLVGAAKAVKGKKPKANKAKPALAPTMPFPPSSLMGTPSKSAFRAVFPPSTAIPLPFPSSSLMGTPSLLPFGTPFPASTLGKTPKAKRKYTKKASMVDGAAKTAKGKNTRAKKAKPTPVPTMPFPPSTAIPTPFPSSSLMGPPSLSPYGLSLFGTARAPISSTLGTPIPSTTLGKLPNAKRKSTKKASMLGGAAKAAKGKKPKAKPDPAPMMPFSPSSLMTLPDVPLFSTVGTPIQAPTLAKPPKVKRKYTKKASMLGGAAKAAKGKNPRAKKAKPAPVPTLPFPSSSLMGTPSLSPIRLPPPTHPSPFVTPPFPAPSVLAHHYSGLSTQGTFGTPISQPLFGQLNALQVAALFGNTPQALRTYAKFVSQWKRETQTTKAKLPKVTKTPKKTKINIKKTKSKTQTLKTTKKKEQPSKKKLTKTTRRETLTDAKFCTGPLAKLKWSKWEHGVSKSRNLKQTKAKHRFNKEIGGFVKTNLLPSMEFEYTTPVVWEFGVLCHAGRVRKIHPVYYNVSGGYKDNQSWFTYFLTKKHHVKEAVKSIISNGGDIMVRRGQAKKATDKFKETLKKYMDKFDYAWHPSAGRKTIHRTLKRKGTVISSSVGT